MLALEKLAKDLGKRLKQHCLTIATAESCTGGGLAYWITSIPGSSTWFNYGFITYSDTAKIALLHLSPTLLNTHSAVSEPVARSMAEGGLKESQADICIATTGIAGPEGGTPQTPVGTVWISIASKKKTTLAFVDIYHGDREQIRQKVIKKALETTLTLF